ncbi:hypothetical protein NXG04_07780 [Klebsiella pneumoniae]|nr:hypothetical protein [Klebsiella pneumoniae]MDS7714454.1 hypothetical protein [Klebsiella pneumoniae]
MREIITEELIAKFAREYKISKSYDSLVRSGCHIPLTFEQYVEIRLVERENIIRKALDYIETKKA